MILLAAASSPLKYSTNENNEKKRIILQIPVCQNLISLQYQKETDQEN